MSKNYVVGVDGSEGSIRAAQYASAQAGTAGASLKLIHVLHWSAYTFLTPEELDERHKRRREELDRAKTAILNPVLEKIDSENAVAEARYGDIADVISEYAAEVNADQIFIGRHGGGGGLSSRLFGSVPSTLVQISNVPVTVIP